MTVMKKGTNTKMNYQQGQTRLSSQYAKRGVSKFTLRTFISLLPYQGADHLTFEAGVRVISEKNILETDFEGKKICNEIPGIQ